jgi:hypothetical protein
VKFGSIIARTSKGSPTRAVEQFRVPRDVLERREGSSYNRSLSTSGVTTVPIADAF